MVMGVIIGTIGASSAEGPGCTYCYHPHWHHFISGSQHPTDMCRSGTTDCGRIDDCAEAGAWCQEQICESDQGCNTIST